MSQQDLLHTLVYPGLTLIVIFVLLRGGKFLGRSKKKDE